MLLKALITSLAISAAAAAPAAAKPADVHVVNTVSVAGTLGTDPAANTVRITETVPVAVSNSVPIPVAPVRSTAEVEAFDVAIQLEDGEVEKTQTLIPDILGKRFEAQFASISVGVNGDVQQPLMHIAGTIDANTFILGVPLSPSTFGARTTWSRDAFGGFVTDGETTVHILRDGGTDGQMRALISVFGRLVDEDAPAS